MATTDGTFMSLNQLPKYFYLRCNEIDERFNEYGVLMSKKQILGLVDMAVSVTIEKVLLSYKGSYRNITKYTDEELNSHYKNNTIDFQNWCNDVAIYYSTRLILYKKSIPTMDNEEEDEEEDDDERLIKALEKDKANKKKEKEETLKKEKEERLKKEAKETKEADKKKAKEKFKKQKEDDEALIQAVQEQKAKTKKQSIQDLTRQANKKKAKKERLRKEFEESAAEKELEKLKEKKKKQQKKSSKA